MQLKIPDNSSISKMELLKMQDTIESWRGNVLGKLLKEVEAYARTCHDLPSANKAVEKYLKPHFDARCLQCVECVLNSGLEFTELGIFGSYARGDYKATSDIDFYAIVTEHPDRVLSGNLRQDLEDMGADLVYIRKDSDSLLSKEIRRDGVKLLQ